MTVKLWNRNFTMVVIGQIISLFGNTILRFAMSTYIMDITGSATAFAGVLALSMIPTILLSPVGGMIADRVNRRNIMVILDFVTAGLCAVFALLFDRLSAIPLFTVILILLAIIQSFYNPSVQTSVPLLQSGDNVMRGNAIVNQVSMLANLTGPFIGGMLYGLWGLAPIIVISVICFFLSAVLEIFIAIPFECQPSKNRLLQTMKADFTESMHFMVKEQPAVLKALVSVSMFNLFLSSMANVAMNYFILPVLGLGSELLGLAESFVGIGGLLGGLLAGVFATKIRVRGLHGVLTGAAICILPVAFAFLWQLPVMAIYWTLVICLGLFGTAGSLFSIAALSAIQQRTPTQLLGKVYGYIMTLCMVSQPIGSVLYGILFDAFSRQVYIVLFGAVAASVLVGLFSRETFKLLDGKGPDEIVPEC